MSRRVPRQRGGMRVFGIGVLLVLLLAGGGALAATTYYNQQLQARTTAATTVDIPQGTSTSGVADILSRRGLLKNTLVFEYYVRSHGFTVQAGQYTIPRGASLEEIVALLSHNQGGVAVRVTIPEGYTAKQIAALMEQKGLFPAADFLAATRQPYPDDFLAGHDPALGLDGYLFPDTYQFSPRATPAQVIETLLKRFGDKLTPDLRARSPHGMTLAQAIVMASIVEKEGFFDKDRPAIAGVFYNRLDARMPLQSDATVAYAKGQAGANISEADKLLNSPYNTYLHTGLPPGGISNPGMPSILAALQPMAVDYLYYLTDKDGHAHFSKTYPQHQQCQVNLAVCPTLP